MESSSIRFIVTKIKTCIEVAWNIYCELKKEGSLSVIDKVNLFSKVGEAGVFKTRYGLIAFIVVDLWKPRTICICRKRKTLSNKQLSLSCF